MSAAESQLTDLICAYLRPGQYGHGRPYAEADMEMPTDIEIPYGFLLIAHAKLVHAGTATTSTQPLDGRPRLHFYIGAESEWNIV